MVLFDSTAIPPMQYHAATDSLDLSSDLVRITPPALRYDLTFSILLSMDALVLQQGFAWPISPAFHFFYFRIGLPYGASG
jgi:hypothetical protein